MNKFPDLDLVTATLLALSLLSFLAAYVALLRIVLNNSRRRRALRAELKRPPMPLEDKLSRIAELGSEIGRLNAEVQDQITVQQAETERLKNEADKAQKVTSLNKEGLEAAQSLVRSEMEAIVATGSKNERRFQIGLAVASFLAGVGSSIAVTWIFGLISAAQSAGPV